MIYSYSELSIKRIWSKIQINIWSSHHCLLSVCQLPIRSSNQEVTIHSIFPRIPSSLISDSLSLSPFSLSGRNLSGEQLLNELCNFYICLLCIFFKKIILFHINNILFSYVNFAIEPWKFLDLSSNLYWVCFIHNSLFVINGVFFLFLKKL